PPAAAMWFAWVKNKPAKAYMKQFIAPAKRQESSSRPCSGFRSAWREQGVRRSAMWDAAWSLRFFLATFLFLATWGSPLGVPLVKGRGLVASPRAASVASGGGLLG